MKHINCGNVVKHTTGAESSTIDANDTINATITPIRPDATPINVTITAINNNTIYDHVHHHTHSFGIGPCLATGILASVVLHRMGRIFDELISHSNNHSAPYNWHNREHQIRGNPFISV